jgi:hypothetical protein
MGSAEEGRCEVSVTSLEANAARVLPTAQGRVFPNWQKVQERQNVGVSLTHTHAKALDAKILSCSAFVSITST